MNPSDQKGSAQGAKGAGGGGGKGPSPPGDAPPVVQWEGPQTFVSPLPDRPPEAAPAETVDIGWPPVPLRPPRLSTRLEILLGLSGLGLAIFMLMHMGLLFSAVLGAETMDSLAEFLEANYFLQIGWPPLVVLILAHVILATRKLPNTARQQISLWRHIRTLRHLDTWLWGVQIVTGLALLILASIHLWVVLTTVPIEAAKSGARVHGIYLWFYIPLLLLVETHISCGLYRLVVKWFKVRRKTVHIIFLVYTVFFLGLGFLILWNFFRIGAKL